jgi:hypothetical protein
MSTAPHARMDGSADRFLLAKLCREISHAELVAGEHAVREAKRLGAVPPVDALEEVALHALAMRPRFLAAVRGHEIRLGRRRLVGTTLATLRHLVVDRVGDGERAFRTALLDLRHGLDMVTLLHGIARGSELFAVIRWSADWLAERRTLVARVEAQLAWYVEQATAAQDAVSAPGERDDWHADRNT